ncbi:hypothetical protein PGT21_028554 [Puccinia graminis f. sp. tritici]|uniref:Uncharacterized protein n=1 Tax=Puccinia graminis f. sp. tritici TaxID=56615 RepID=A0A5B0Q6R2_PUCGR|nr:hypothetical protein PGT21_028554 [Puccinia graminis f. sp. tritici]
MELDAGLSRPMDTTKWNSTGDEAGLALQCCCPVAAWVLQQEVLHVKLWGYSVIVPTYIFSTDSSVNYPFCCRYRA